MGRRSGGGGFGGGGFGRSSGGKAAPAPTPAPVQSQPAAGGLGSAFADGMAFGSDNAVGHRCLNSNGGNLSKCQFYMDMVCECRRSSTTGLNA
ncbi:putative transcription factor-like [Capsicum annuum]|nr:putative transcription factor-like [Capsicum annuum]KAF3645533.1 putative transcription factor-like [Capsicum annuum]